MWCRERSGGRHAQLHLSVRFLGLPPLSEQVTLVEVLAVPGVAALSVAVTATV
jgi:hypothetical protein